MTSIPPRLTDALRDHYLLERELGSDQLGREINSVVWTAAEFRSRVAAHDHFLTSVLRGPRLMVAGDEHELEELGSGTRRRGR